MVQIDRFVALSRTCDSQARPTNAVKEPLGPRFRGSFDPSERTPPRNSRFMNRHQSVRSPQVVCHALEPHLRCIPIKTHVSHSAVAVCPLQRTEDLLHRCSHSRYQFVAPLLPVRESSLVLVRPMHRPVLDTQRLEPFASLFGLIGPVTVHRRLVPRHQVICHLAESCPSRPPHLCAPISRFGRPAPAPRLRSVSSLRKRLMVE